MLSHHKSLNSKVHSVIYFWVSFGGSHSQLHIDDCLQGYVNTVSYLRQYGSCLLGCTLSVI